MSTENTTSTLIDAKLIDIDGLKAFWQSVESYISENYIASLDERIGANEEAISINADAIGVLQETVSGLTGGEGSVSSQIAAALESYTNTEGMNDAISNAIEKAVGSTGENGTGLLKAIETAENNAIETAAETLSTAIGHFSEQDENGNTTKESEGLCKDIEDRDVVVLSSANDYTDDEIQELLDNNIATLENAMHTHGNKAELDLIESGDKARWDSAAEEVELFFSNDGRVKEAIDSLTEIVNWMTNDDNKNAADLVKAIADEETAREDADTGLSNRITELEDAKDDYATADEAQYTKISNELTASIATPDEILKEIFGTN